MLTLTQGATLSRLLLALALAMLASGCESEPTPVTRTCVDSAEPCPKPACKSDGYCTRNGAGCCAAVTDSDCETSERCMEFGYCIARGGVCVGGSL
jgi:hypothetical protein